MQQKSPSYRKISLGEYSDSLYIYSPLPSEALDWSINTQDGSEPDRPETEPVSQAYEDGENNLIWLLVCVTLMLLIAVFWGSSDGLCPEIKSAEINSTKQLSILNK